MFGALEARLEVHETGRKAVEAVVDQKTRGLVAYGRQCCSGACHQSVARLCGGGSVMMELWRCCDGVLIVVVNER